MVSPEGSQGLQQHAWKKLVTRINKLRKLRSYENDRGWRMASISNRSVVQAERSSKTLKLIYQTAWQQITHRNLHRTCFALRPSFELHILLGFSTTFRSG